MNSPNKRVFLSLGSNLGDRLAYLKRALRLLADRGIRIVRWSSVYETEPVDFTDQKAFLNIACEASTPLTPPAVLDNCLAVEREIGRTRTVPKGPREIDIDILFYNNLITTSSTLEIPHPRLHLRNFVLVPLNEIAPDVIHPRLGVSVKELLNASSDSAAVERILQPGALASGDGV